MTAARSSLEWVRSPHEGTSMLRWKDKRMTQSKAWETLCSAFAAQCHEDCQVEVKLFRGGQPVVNPALWPHHTAAASGPQKWVSSMKGANYFAWARNVQTVDRDVFESVVEFSDRCVAHRGLASGPTEAELFMGDYRWTPGGVHRESCSNLHLVLRGLKSMHFWASLEELAGHREPDSAAAEGTGTPEEYLPGLSRTRALSTATSFTAGAGEGFGWRSGTWHVGETHGLAVALNIATYQRGGYEEPTLEPWCDPVRGNVPEDWLHQYLRHIRVAGGHSAALAALSSFNTVPAMPVWPELRGRHGRWRLDVPVVWTHAPSGHLLVAAMGRVRSFPCSTPLLDWLSSASHTGGEIRVPEEASDLAAWLHSEGVLEIEPGCGECAAADALEAR